MDRNSIIGFVLLALLGTGYIIYTNNEQKAFREQQRINDSIAAAQAPPPVVATNDTNNSVTLISTSDDTAFVPNAFRGKNESIILSNQKLSLTFNTKGGAPIAANLKDYKTYGQDDLYLFNGEENKFEYTFPLSNSQTIKTSELFFTPQLNEIGGGSKELIMTAEVAEGKSVQLRYVLPEDGYQMNASVRFIGFQNELTANNNIALNWTTKALRTEKSLKNERLNFQAHYRYEDKEHDYFTLERTPKEEFSKGIEWYAVKTHFFNATIIADKPFKGGFFDSEVPDKDTTFVGQNTVTLQIPAEATQDYAFSFKWLISPNDYDLLKQYKIDLEEMIPLGFGIFFFVKYISKWMILPLFNTLNSFIGNVGISIMLLTLIIRLLLSFFSYKSYLSSAKMRVLKPEIDILKAKYKDNNQQFGMEQMKLYRTAGVNPLGGCLPLLLQMPFLLSMYYFFPTSLDLRQQKFLWADDLSSYDSIFSWSTEIWGISSIYGNHVSLFTILMTITSLFLALYNKNMTSGQEMNNPALKYMPYIMPIMFLGWFNSMAAGLTFYYTFSNLISIVQQFVIQKFFINEEKILKKIEENKKNPAKATSKWQQRLEEMQKQQASTRKK